MSRPSILPVGELCGHAIKLSEENKQGSFAAAEGTAKHALMEGAVNGTLDKRHPYCAVVACLPPGRREAEVQVELRDTITGDYIIGAPDKDGKRTGKTDIVVTSDDGGLTIGDWKFGDPLKVMPPDDNLQALAYGVSLAIARNAPWFKVFIWTERAGFNWGTRKWLPEDYQGIVDRITRALAMRRDEPIVGPHCGDMCYSRSYCKAWMLPVVSDGPTALEPFTKENGISADNVKDAVIKMKAMSDALAIVKGRVEAWIDEHGPIVVDKKEYGPIETRGRRSISLAVVESKGLYETLDKAGCISQGRDSVQYRWINAKPKKAA